MTEPTTHTLAVSGATITYGIWRADTSTAPTLLLIGSPMGASGFPTLAGYLTDRTIATYDRGVERSILPFAPRRCLALPRLEP